MQAFKEDLKIQESILVQKSNQLVRDREKLKLFEKRVIYREKKA